MCALKQYQPVRIRRGRRYSHFLPLLQSHDRIPIHHPSPPEGSEKWKEGRCRFWVCSRIGHPIVGPTEKWWEAVTVQIKILTELFVYLLPMIRPKSSQSFRLRWCFYVELFRKTSDFWTCAFASFFYILRLTPIIMWRFLATMLVHRCQPRNFACDFTLCWMPVFLA